MSARTSIDRSAVKGRTPFGGGDATNGDSGCSLTVIWRCYCEMKRQASFRDENGNMRKRIVRPNHAQQGGQSDKGWFNLEQIATVEVTSEDPRFPIESAFGSNDGPGWRASRGGEQQIRIIFDEPVSVHRIELRFHEADYDRTQEFTLRWSPESGGSAIEIVRQQWNFSPAGSTTEIELYLVHLDAVSVLELAIRPDLRRQEAVATLASWRVG
jgi:hypothetical protein